MISCLNSDALEKRLEYPGEGWRGGECVNGHGVFGKSKPLGAAWCLQSHLVAVFSENWGGGSETNWSRPGDRRDQGTPGDQQRQQQLNVDQILA